MKKEDYKELNDKELLERLDAAEKEYVQTKDSAFYFSPRQSCKDHCRQKKYRAYENRSSRSRIKN